jgi:hypothetical protein
MPWFAVVIKPQHERAVGLDPMPDRYDLVVHINNQAIEYLSGGLPIVSSPQLHVQIRTGQECRRCKTI